MKDLLLKEKRRARRCSRSSRPHTQTQQGRITCPTRRGRNKKRRRGRRRKKRKEDRRISLSLSNRPTFNHLSRPLPLTNPLLLLHLITSNQRVVLPVVQVDGGVTPSPGILAGHWEGEDRGGGRSGRSAPPAVVPAAPRLLLLQLLLLLPAADDFVRHGGRQGGGGRHNNGLCVPHLQVVDGTHSRARVPVNKVSSRRGESSERGAP